MRIVGFFSWRYALVLLPLIFGAIGYGMAAANTVTLNGAGDGSGTVAGYTVSNIQTVLDIANDPTQILSISFQLTPVSAGASAPATVYARFLNSSVQSGSWYTCTLSGTRWNCTTSGTTATVQSGIQLQVSAAQ